MSGSEYTCQTTGALEAGSALSMASECTPHCRGLQGFELSCPLKLPRECTHLAASHVCLDCQASRGAGGCQLCKHEPEGWEQAQAELVLDLAIQHHRVISLHSLSLYSSQCILINA